MFYIYIYTIWTETNDSCGRAAIGQLWIAVLLVCGCIGLARLLRRTLAIRESIGDWRMVILTVIRMLNVDRKYRKCESKYERVNLLYNLGVANVLVL